MHEVLFIFDVGIAQIMSFSFFILTGMRCLKTKEVKTKRQNNRYSVEKYKKKNGNLKSTTNMISF